MLQNPNFPGPTLNHWCGDGVGNAVRVGHC